MTTPNYDEICYNQNFLTEVIARIDFLNPIIELKKKIPTSIIEQAKKYFKIPEPKKAIAQELKLTPKELKTTRRESNEWIFHGLNRDKSLTITPISLFVKYDLYKTYEILKNEFLSVVNEAFNNFKELQVRRLGLRYINNISLNESNPLEWDKYINENMLSLLRYSKETDYLSRVFHNLEYNFGEFNFRFQFGIHNSDYPAIIKKKNFILDFDSYYNGLQEHEDILTSLDKYHSKIQEFFEYSIKDELRNLLNE